MIKREFASIILIDEENKVLLNYRDKQRKHMPDMWAFFGGKIESEESVEEALRRETKEELDYNLREPQFLIETKNTWVKEEGEELHIMHVFIEYINENDKSSLKLLEGSDWGWFDIDDALKLNILDVNIESLNKLKSILLNEN